MPLSPAERRSWLAHAVVVAGLVAVVGGLWHGLSGELLLAHPMGEAPGHLWMQWLLERRLLQGSDFVGATGIVLDERLWVMPTDPLSRALAMPVGLLLGRTAAYNCTVIALLAAGAVGVATLARRLGASPLPAAAGALLFLWSPALLGFASDGRVDSLGICWLPLLALAWLRLVRSPSLANGLLLGGTGALVALAGLNHAVVAAVVALVPTMVAVAQDRRRALPFALAGALSAVVVGGLLWALVQVEGHDPARLQQVSNPEGRQAFMQVTTAMIHEGRMADFWWGAQRLHRESGAFTWWQLPSTLLKIGHTHHAADMLTAQSFAPGGFWWLPLAPWALVLVGLVRHPRAVAPLAAIAVLGQLLGLGLGFPHTLPISLGSTTVYLAPAVLWEGVPGLGRFNNYGLFSVVTAMAHGLIAARVLTGLPRAGVVAAAVVAVWGVEVQRGPVPLPIDTTHMAVPAPLQAFFERVPTDAGVVVLPLSRDVSFYLQTQHERPSPHRFRAASTKGRQDPMLSDRSGALHQLVLRAQGRRPPGSRGGADLRHAGLGAVVLLPHLLPPKHARAVEENLTETLGTPQWSGPEGMGWLLR